MHLWACVCDEACLHVCVNVCVCVVHVIACIKGTAMFVQLYTRERLSWRKCGGRVCEWVSEGAHKRKQGVKKSAQE